MCVYLQVRELFYAALSTPHRFFRRYGTAETFFNRLFDKWVAIYESECKPGTWDCATCGTWRMPMFRCGPNAQAPKSTSGPPARPTPDAAPTNASNVADEILTCRHLQDSAPHLSLALDGGVTILSYAASKVLSSRSFPPVRAHVCSVPEDVYLFMF